MNLELELKIESGTGYRTLDEGLQDNSKDFLNIDAFLHQ
jgi:hypothetical protein